MSASTMTMEKANKIAQERIAELEQANEIWRADFAKLKAEVERLREENQDLRLQLMSKIVDQLTALVPDG